MKYITT